MKVGYYRYKTTATDGRIVTFYKNGILAQISTIRALPFCQGDRIVKYLDHTGQYRFYVFNKFYEIKEKPTLIGSTSRFVTSLLSDQSDKEVIGYKNERQMLLTTEANADQLAVLSDIFTSPKVYLYIGFLPSDELSDWVEVTVTGDTTVKRRKAISGKVDITITLPEYYTIRRS